MVYLWRAMDAEGEVLDVLVQSKGNKRIALKLMRKMLKKYGFVPDKLVTDDPRSYAAAEMCIRDSAGREQLRNLFVRQQIQSRDEENMNESREY